MWLKPMKKPSTIIKIEYSSGDFGPGDGADCTTGTWSEDPNNIATPTVDDQGRTVWDTINRVRVSYTTEFPIDAPSTGSLWVAIGQVVTDTEDESPIGNWASHLRANGVLTTNEVINDPKRVSQISSYDPETHTGSFGDRLLLGDAIVRVTKAVQNPTTGSWEESAAPQYTTGSTVNYRLRPTLTAPIVVEGNTAEVVLEDCLPRYQLLTDSTQAGEPLTPELVQMGAPETSELSCADNRQYVRWNLGELPVGHPIEPIVVSTEILEVAGNGNYMNNVLVSSNSDGSPASLRADDAQVQLVVPTGIKIAKTVDKQVIELNPEGVTDPRTLNWSVQFANIDAPTNVSNVDVIDVLPAAGENGNAFEGSLQFDSVTTPVNGMNILYTSTPTTELNSDPAHATNDAEGATVWCDAVSGDVVLGDGSAADCPQLKSEVTGLRFQLAGAFEPGDAFQVDIAMTPVGNAGGDIYRNITSGRADGVSQSVGPASRQVSVVESTVGDRVWLDANADGVQNDGEAGVPGVPVRLIGTDVDGNSVDLTTVSDLDGEYLFEGLASGTYKVAFDVSGMTGYTFTEKSVGEDAAVDSDADPVTGVSDEFTLDLDTDDLTIDAGLIRHMGGLVINKLLDGVGVKDFASQDELDFSVVCTFDEQTVFERDVTLHVEGQSSVTSEELGPIPAGSECTVTETSGGNADPGSLPEPVDVVIPWKPELGESGTVTASLTNYYSAGSVEVSKALQGDDLAVEAAKNRVFEILVTCQIEEKDETGESVRSDVYSGIVKIRGGQTKFLVNDDDETWMLPLHARCFGEETETGGAQDSNLDFDSWGNSVAVTEGTPEELQVLTISAVNTFKNAELTVSKQVEGTGTGGKYDFTLSCTLPETSETGERVDIDYALSDDDAKFALKHGQSRTVTVPAGASCQVSEVNVPENAQVTIVDSDETTTEGKRDGIVTNLVGVDNSVDVTNTFETGSGTLFGGTALAMTGGKPVGAALLIGLGLLIMGAGLTLLHKRQETNSNHNRNSTSP